MRTSGRSSFSCIQMTFESRDSSRARAAGAASAAFVSGVSPGFTTRYLTIFVSILWSLIVVTPAPLRGALEFAVVLHHLVALQRELAAVLEREHVSRVLEVILLDEHALEGIRVETERRAAFEPLLVGVEIDVLEILVAIVGRHVGRLRDRGIDPFLRRRLDVDVLPRRHVVGGREIVGQPLARRN